MLGGAALASMHSHAFTLSGVTISQTGGDILQQNGRPLGDRHNHVRVAPTSGADLPQLQELTSQHQVAHGRGISWDTNGCCHFHHDTLNTLHLLFPASKPVPALQSTSLATRNIHNRGAIILSAHHIWTKGASLPPPLPSCFFLPLPPTSSPSPSFFLPPLLPPPPSSSHLPSPLSGPPLLPPPHLPPAHLSLPPLSSL